MFFKNTAFKQVPQAAIIVELKERGGFAQELNLQVQPT